MQPRCSAAPLTISSTFVNEVIEGRPWRNLMDKVPGVAADMAHFPGDGAVAYLVRDWVSPVTGFVAE